MKFYPIMDHPPEVEDETVIPLGQRADPVEDRDRGRRGGGVFGGGRHGGALVPWRSAEGKADRGYLFV